MIDLFLLIVLGLIIFALFFWIGLMQAKGYVGEGPLAE
jgi:hypothetical protein